jgi:hypothetical protein
MHILGHFLSSINLKIKKKHDIPEAGTASIIW